MPIPFTWSSTATASLSEPSAAPAAKMLSADSSPALASNLPTLTTPTQLAPSAAWADDVGYVECSSHPDGTQVFAKPRKSPEVVASMACGERFTILVYGFVFSRVQTGDGKIGYVYSNMIAVDRAAAPVQKSASPQMVAASEKVPIRTAPVEQPAPPPVAKPQPAPAQSTVTAASVSAAPQPVSSAPASPAPAASAAPTSAAATPNLPEITVPAAPPAPAPAPASGRF